MKTNKKEAAPEDIRLPLMESQPPYVMAFYNQKGGVAKTTSSVNLANEIGKLGYKVLLVDYDPQCSASYMCNLDIYDEEQLSVGSVLIPYVIKGIKPTASDIREAIITPTYMKKVKKDKSTIWEEKEVPFEFDLLPCTGDALSTVELSISTPKTYLCNNPTHIRFLCKMVVDIIRRSMDYDFIFIDTNPTFGNMSVAAIYASDFLFMPTTADFLATAGMKPMVNRLQALRTYIPQYSLLGAAFTIYSKRRVSDIEAVMDIKNLSQSLGESFPLFTTMIPEDYANVRNAVMEGGTISTSIQQSKPIAKQYKFLAHEIVTKFFDRPDLWDYMSSNLTVLKEIKKTLEKRKDEENEEGK